MGKRFGIVLGMGSLFVITAIVTALLWKWLHSEDYTIWIRMLKENKNMKIDSFQEKSRDLFSTYQISDGFLYYLEDQKLYQYRYETKEEHRIAEQVLEFIVFDKKVYYLRENQYYGEDNQDLYYTYVDNIINRKRISKKIKSFYIYNNKIFIIRNNQIYELEDINGGEKEFLKIRLPFEEKEIDYYKSILYISGNKLIISNGQEKPGKIYAYDLKTNNFQQIFNKINDSSLLYDKERILDDSLYIQCRQTNIRKESEYKAGIWKVNVKNGEVKKITDEVFDDVYIFNKKIYVLKNGKLELL